MANSSPVYTHLSENTDAVLKLNLGERGNRRINFRKLWDSQSGQISFQRLADLAVHYSLLSAQQKHKNKGVSANRATAHVTYIDEDGEVIDISSDEELAEAFHQFLSKTPPVRVVRASAKVRGFNYNVEASPNPNPFCQPRALPPTVVAAFPTESRPKVRIPASYQSDFVHKRHTCDGCSTAPIIGYRFRATNLPNYDLCEKCFGNYKGDDILFEACQSKSRPCQPFVHRNTPSNRKLNPLTPLPPPFQPVLPVTKTPVPSAPTPVVTVAAPEEKVKILPSFESDFIHGRHTCDGCFTTPIIGYRFNATNLPDYDLCEKCFGNYKGDDILFEANQLQRDEHLQTRWKSRYLRQSRRRHANRAKNIKTKTFCKGPSAEELSVPVPVPVEVPAEETKPVSAEVPAEETKPVSAEVPVEETKPVSVEVPVEETKPVSESASPRDVEDASMATAENETQSKIAIEFEIANNELTTLLSQCNACPNEVDEALRTFQEIQKELEENFPNLNTTTDTIASSSCNEADKVDEASCDDVVIAETIAITQEDHELDDKSGSATGDDSITLSDEANKVDEPSHDSDVIEGRTISMQEDHKFDDESVSTTGDDAISSSDNVKNIDKTIHDIDIIEDTTCFTQEDHTFGVKGASTNGDDQSQISSTASSNSWEVVAEDDNLIVNGVNNQTVSDEMVAQAAQMLGSALFSSQADMASETDVTHVFTDANASEATPYISDSVCSAFTSVPTITSEISPSLLSRWEDELYQLHEIGFLDDRKNVEAFGHLEAANIGVGSDDKVTVEHVVDYLLKQE